MVEDNFQQDRRFRIFEKDAESVIKQTTHLNIKSKQNDEFTEGKPPHSELSNHTLEHQKSKRRSRQPVS